MRVIIAALVLVASIVFTPAASAENPEVAWDGSLLVQLAVKDLDASIVFCRDLLGWTIEARVDELKCATGVASRSG